MDKTGAIVAVYAYDAWGNHKIASPSLNCDITTGDEYKNEIGRLNPFRYRGYYFDEENGLYYLQTRYYDPVYGRFLNMDTVDYLDPETINGCNLYAYCNNNPVMYIDPTGKSYSDWSKGLEALAWVFNRAQDFLKGGTLNNLQAKDAFGLINPFFKYISLAFGFVSLGLNVLENLSEGKGFLRSVSDASFDFLTTSYFVSLGSILLSIFGPAGMFLGGIAGAAVGLYVENSNSIKPYMEELKESFFNGLESAVVDTFNFIKSATDTVAYAVGDFVNDGIDAYVRFWNKLVGG